MTNYGNNRTNRTNTLKDYIFLDKQNRTLIISATIAILLLITIYKYLYPFASFIYGDSYCYIDEAERNVQIGTYPIGYPMFLRAFSAITVSDTALVIFQFFLLQASVLMLLFTIFYFYDTNYWLKITLIFTTAFNPIFLHLANTVSSDNFFFSLSLLWFTSLVWIILKPTRKIQLFHIILLFLAFTVRYNALYYPLITTVGLVISRAKMRFKIESLFLGILLIGGFIKYNQDKYYELCNIRQFTPFSGWLLANNALYAYRYLPNINHKDPPANFKNLDDAVRTYFDSTRNNPRHPEEQVKAYHDYMWKDTSPLSVYWRNNFLKGKNISVEQAWATAGPYYKEYGSWVIKQYPDLFLKHVIFPNFIRWFHPPIEFLEYYNSGYNNVTDSVKKWFKYKNNFVRTNLSDPFLFDIINGLYVIWATAMNIIFVFGVALYFITKSYKQNRLLTTLIIIAFITWIVNALFSITASPIALRFQMFPIQISAVFSFLLIDYFLRDNQQKEELQVKS